MEYNFVFAIDCDEVLRKTLDRMVELYNKHFDAKKTKEEIKDYKVEKSFPEIEEVTGMTASHWFFQEHSTELFWDTEPFPHIKEDIDTLRKYGKVVILTYQKSYQNKIETLMWLQKYGIEADGVCFLKDKTMLTADYLVDDNDWNFNGSHVKHGILVDAPYNKDKDINKLLYDSCCDTIERKHTLHDFVVSFEQAVNDLERIKLRYPSKNNLSYKLKAKVPYTDSTVYRNERLFGEVGDEVKVKHYYINGTEPKVRVELGRGWGDVTINVNDLEKYI